MPGNTPALTRGDFANDLMWAAYRGDAEEVRKIINDHPDQLGPKRGRVKIGWVIRDGTALMIAAARGHAEVVMRLMEYEHGMRDGNRKTALIAAAQAGHEGVVRLLVDLEGRLKGDSNGKTPLMWAEQGRHKDVARFLRERELLTPLMRAVLEGDGDAVNRNLREAKKRNGCGWTALMFAAAYGRLDYVQLLLGEESGIKDRDGGTALMKAAASGHTDCVEELLDKEGGIQDHDGETALMYAVRNGHTDCVGLRLLLEKEKDMRNKWGETALKIAESIRDDEATNNEERRKYEGIIRILQGQNGN